MEFGEESGGRVWRGFRRGCVAEKLGVEKLSLLKS